MLFTLCCSGYCWDIIKWHAEGISLGTNFDTKIEDCIFRGIFILFPVDIFLYNYLWLDTCKTLKFLSKKKKKKPRVWGWTAKVILAHFPDSCIEYVLVESAYFVNFLSTVIVSYPLPIISICPDCNKLQVRTRAVSLQKLIQSKEEILTYASKLLKAELPLSLRLMGM